MFSLRVDDSDATESSRPLWADTYVHVYIIYDTTAAHENACTLLSVTYSRAVRAVQYAN